MPLLSIALTCLAIFTWSITTAIIITVRLHTTKEQTRVNTCLRCNAMHGQRVQAAARNNHILSSVLLSWHVSVPKSDIARYDWKSRLNFTVTAHSKYQYHRNSKAEKKKRPKLFVLPGLFVQ